MDKIKHRASDTTVKSACSFNRAQTTPERFLIHLRSCKALRRTESLWAVTNCENHFKA